MKIKIKEVDYHEVRVSKTFILDIGNGKEIMVNKWLVDGNYPNAMAESDYEVLDGRDADAYEELNDEDRDEVDDFISNLDLMKRNYD